MGVYLKPPLFLRNKRTNLDGFKNVRVSSKQDGYKAVSCVLNSDIKQCLLKKEENELVKV